MEYKPNPILEQQGEEPPQFKALRAQQSAITHEIVEMQRLCFEIFFMTDNGKKLYDILLKKFIIPAKFVPTETNAQNLALYWEGFKDALRGLYNHGDAHLKRINEGNIR